ncbi:hypothetical protein [Nannocystis pusilla]|uniref:hypothetical protein n=1 Tax=Nannocystis pusilla TaxID=889268 RepID=UPI003DA47D11
MLEWTEPSTQLDKGVDHLGLRAAGESCISRLIDFTTTVSWRPRYLSFYCWAAQQAFLRAGGRLDGQTHRVDARVYRNTFKRLDFALAAATLVDNEAAQSITGSRLIKGHLSRAPFVDTGRLPLTADHLKASMGGFAVYAGPMRLLGLLGSAVGFDVPLPGTLGANLAHAFGRSLSATNVHLLDAEALDSDELARLGAVCGLDFFSERAAANPPVAEELRLVRSALLDWQAFQDGKGPSAPRILSVGIILELYRLAAGNEVDLDTFRAATLLGEAELAGTEHIALKLPPIYAEVLSHWRVYQAHAYATLALESLLALALDHAHRAAADGDYYRVSRLVEVVLADIRVGAAHTKGSLPDDLARWLSLHLRDVARARWQDLREHEIAARLAQEQWGSGPALGYEASLLFVLSTLRMRHLLQSGDRWIGHNASWRLPPDRLISAFEQAARTGTCVSQFLSDTLEHRVLHQHRVNALRKLVARPSADSARFAVEGARMVPLGDIRPGTSSPRFFNAVEYLFELGYLERETRAPSTDGLAVLRRIGNGGAA